MAFKTPNGKKVLLVVNTSGENDPNSAVTETFEVSFNGKWVTTSLEAGSVGTFIW